MTETFCTYSKGRDELLVAYLYNDIEPAERVRFEAHLAACSRCRAEVSALTEVRTELARWSPPESLPGRRVEAPPTAFQAASRSGGPRAGEPRPSGSRTGGWWAMPVWAQVAAAMLCLGIGAGVANLDVRYDSNGLSLRTGWTRGLQGMNRPATSPDVPVPPAVGVTPADLKALETRMRSELRAAQAAQAAQTAQAMSAARPASAAADSEVMRRVGALVSESEKRQQRELALRVADVMRDLDTQRRADLVKIDRSLGLIQDNAGVEVLKQRELLNYLVRASQSK